MRIRFLFIITAIIFGISLNLAFAARGFETGNGGDAILCPGETYRLLDYREHKVENLKLEGTDLIQKVDWVLSKLSKVSYNWPVVLKFRAFKMIYEIQSILKTQSLHEANNLSLRFTELGYDLVDIRDSRSVSLDVLNNCRIEQLAIHIPADNAIGFKLKLSYRILKKLSLDDIAGLVIHEVLYHSFIGANGVYHSQGVRALNFHLSSMKKEVGLVSFLQLLDELELLNDYFRSGFSYADYRDYLPQNDVHAQDNKTWILSSFYGAKINLSKSQVIGDQIYFSLVDPHNIKICGRTFQLTQKSKIQLSIDGFSMGINLNLHQSIYLKGGHLIYHDYVLQKSKILETSCFIK